MRREAIGVDIDRTAPCDPQRPVAEGARSPERADEFVRLLDQNRRGIFMFVMSMVLNRSDAEEIVQETSLLLWREFDRFEPGTNFAAWARRFALNLTLAWRRQRRRDRLEFSSEFLEAVADELTDEADWLEERSRALDDCLAKLPERHRALLRSRYTERRSVEEIGQEVDRSADAVYRGLSRIRRTLYDCVTRSLSRGDR
jgi:RNA polymerase sigma-70 factor, ECF subfamily